MTTTLIGLYDTRDHAQRAVSELVQNGFPREDISLALSDTGKTYTEPPLHEEEADAQVERPIAQGAEVGAAIGGIGGLVIGLTTLAIPVVGPLAVAGPLAALLAGAGLGAAGGGLLGALVKMGLTHDEASAYTEAIRRGNTLVLLETSDDVAPQAKAIMHHCGPIDIAARPRP